MQPHHNGVYNKGYYGNGARYAYGGLHGLYGNGYAPAYGRRTSISPRRALKYRDHDESLLVEVEEPAPLEWTHNRRALLSSQPRTRRTRVAAKPWDGYTSTNDRRLLREENHTKESKRRAYDSTLKVNRGGNRNSAHYYAGTSTHGYTPAGKVRTSTKKGIIYRD